MPQRASVLTYSRLKSSKPCSVKGSAERSSQAAKASLGRPSEARCASTAAKPAAIGRGTGQTERAGCGRGPRRAGALYLESGLRRYPARELEAGLEISVAAGLENVDVGHR